MSDVLDAEFSPSSLSAPGALPADVDPATGEVLEARPAYGLAHAQPRGHLAIGAPAALAMAVKEKALMEARMSIARERPRDWMVVRDRLLKECRRPGFADAAIYSKPVGGQKIEGMSIRFAEACARTMGNLRVTTELVEDEPQKVVYRVTVIDLESGSSFDDEVTLSKTVERSTVKQGQTVVGERTNSRGQKTYVVLATDDELANKKNAAASKAIRNAVLRLVPGDVVDDCRAACEATMTRGAAQDPAAARKALLDAFSAQGVTPKQVAEYLGRDSAEAITPADVVKMRPVFQAIRDGETSWKDMVDARGNGAAKASAPPAPAAAPAAPPPEEDPVAAEARNLRSAIKAAKTRKDLGALLERVTALPGAVREPVETAYREAAKALAT